MKHDALLQIIAGAARSQAKELDLSGQSLTTLPAEIGQLTALEELNLINNQLTALPPEIGQLNALKTLWLDDNQLTALPPEFGQLTKLHWLTLDDNPFSALPPVIWQLTALKRLYFNENQLTALPPEIGQLTAFEELSFNRNQLTALPPEIGQLTGLEELSFNYNQLTALPPEIGQLTALHVLKLDGNRFSALPPEIGQLTALELLWLDGNQLTALPPEFGKLTALRWLTLDGNRYSVQPPEIGRLTALKDLSFKANQLTALPPGIGQLTALEELNLDGNQLTALPPEIGQLTALQELNLDGNQLTTLPPEIGQLHQLKQLYLDGNQLTTLPPELGNLSDDLQLALEGNPLSEPLPELVERGSEAVLTYLRSLDEGVRVYEAKVLLVGEGNVGKTSLVDALLGKPFVEGRPTTHGIQLGQLQLKHPEQDREMTLNTWDFGGQEVYRITHQFFFSRRSLYLLVWRPREGQEENAVEAWLKRIRLRIGEGVKVIIVATHCDERSPELDYPGLKQKFGDMLAGRFEVDNKTGTGIDALRQALAEQAATLPQMGETLNRHWIAARDEVLNLPEPQIPYRQFKEICEAHGLDEQATATLGDLLNDLGHVVYFGDDAGLRDIVVLQPEWLTKAIGYVLEDRATRKANGELAHARLKQIWLDHGKEDFETYPVRYHGYFLRLMEIFDICYRVPDQESSLVGQLVPFERPALPWDESRPPETHRELALVCTMKEEPPGLIAWLTVRNHRFATGFNWRRGVLLRHDDYDSEALFELSDGTDLTLRVRAPSPDYFFSILRDSVEALIGSRWKGLDHDFVVPCPQKLEDGRPCPGRFRLQTLVRRREGERFQIDCQECDETQDVNLLLTGFAIPVDPIALSLDKLHERLDRVDVSAAETADQIRTVLKALSAEITDCPRLFTLVPKDKSKWNPKRAWEADYELSLWCEHPGHEHPCEGAQYTLNLPKEWLKKASPYISMVSKTLRIAVPIVGSAVGMAMDEADLTGIKDDINFMEKLSAAVPGEIGRGQELRDNKSGLSHAEGAGLRSLRNLLFEQDQPRAFGGLQRVLTSSGDYLWICPGHHPKYDPGLPTLPYE